ncbi:MAG: hypothetical protein GX169_06115 [Arcobacter skirrowii]|nr:hypothetical protein [Aliarcobacter skirrowii]
MLSLTLNSKPAPIARPTDDIELSLRPSASLEPTSRPAYHFVSALAFVSNSALATIPAVTNFFIFLPIYFLFVVKKIYYLEFIILFTLLSIK